MKLLILIITTGVVLAISNKKLTKPDHRWSLLFLAFTMLVSGAVYCLEYFAGYKLEIFAFLKVTSTSGENNLWNISTGLISVFAASFLLAKVIERVAKSGRSTGLALITIGSVIAVQTISVEIPNLVNFYLEPDSVLSMLAQITANTLYMVVMSAIFGISLASPKVNDETEAEEG